MTDDHDLDWLIEHRPAVPAATPTTTGRARAALIAHGNRRRRARSRRQGAIAVAVLAGAGAALFIAEDSAGPRAPGDSRPTIAIAPPPAASAPTTRGPTPRTNQASLVSLAFHVRRIRRLPGNATLVSFHFVRGGRHAQRFWSVNLFTDRGPCYYADSLPGLKAAISERRTHRPDISPAALGAIARAAGRSPAAARRAVLAPVGGGPKWTRAQRRAQAKARREYLNGPPRLRRYAPPTPRQVNDSYVWGFAEQALEQGAGRPLVRATAMDALSTIQDVRQAVTRLNGRPALEVSAGTGNNLERLWLQADTGIPVREVDGRGPGANVLTFHVRRVQISRLR